MADLKSCPCCGGEALIDYINDGYFCVICKNCMANTGGTKTKEEAFEKWNRRAKQTIKWPLHKAGMFVSHNEHFNYYQTVFEMISSFGVEVEDFANEADMIKCIDTNEIWSIQWYSQTPVGAFIVYASTFEIALEIAQERSI